MLGSDEAANDVVHDAFLSVYRRWDHVVDPGAYLNRAVLNGCRDTARRTETDARARRRLSSDDIVSATDTDLVDVLRRLPFNQRAAVVLRFYARMTESEIAATLDCRPGSVGPWIHRALKSLRKELS